MVCLRGIRLSRPDVTAALDFFTRWFRTVRRSKLEPLQNVVLTFTDHLIGLLNCFVHPFINARSSLP
jgi:hypothetical protein